MLREAERREDVREAGGCEDVHALRLLGEIEWVGERGCVWVFEGVEE